MLVTNPHPIPLAVGALYALVQTAAAGTEGDRIGVGLGNPGKVAERRFIGVGLSAAMSGQVNDRQARPSLGYDNHVVDVDCTALAWSGDPDRLKWMTEAFDLVDVVRAALEYPANFGLGLEKAVRSARITATDFGWTDERQGQLKAQADFTVQITAYRPRR